MMSVTLSIFVMAKDCARLSCCLKVGMFSRHVRSLIPMWGNREDEAPGPVAEADKSARFS